MILYKYYGFEAGIRAIKSQKLGFREARYFNDPFDLTYIDKSTNALELERVIEFFKKNCVVLSLTRNPCNPLMWAHYGDEHRGFCVGYEIDDELLKSEKHNLIPVGDGDVIYTSVKEEFEVKGDFGALWRELTRVSNKNELFSVERQMQKSINDILKKLLLYKNSAWSYEEEVRVVKVHEPLELGSEDGTLDETHFFADLLNRFSCLSKEVAPGYRVSLVDGLYLFDSQVKIKQIYLGLRNPMLKSDVEPVADNPFSAFLEKQKIEIYKMAMSKGTWSVIAEPCSSSTLSQTAESSLSSFHATGKELHFVFNKLSNNNFTENDRFEFNSFLGNYQLKKNGDFL